MQNIYVLHIFGLKEIYFKGRDFREWKKKNFSRFFTPTGRLIGPFTVDIDF